MRQDGYREFIRFLFDRAPSSADWRFGFELEEPALSGETIVAFVKRMLENYATDLADFSDRQLGMGLEYVFNNSCSDLAFTLRDGPASLDARLDAIRALKVLLRDCLDHRCRPALGHLSGEGNELNRFCYMLWDTTPLTYCEGIDDRNGMYAALAEVMEFSLSLDNIACVESGLHGLGHLGQYYDKAPEIIRHFRQTTKLADPRILQYAKNAESGCIL